jgi:DNA-binding response OmpR family regulator
VRTRPVDSVAARGKFSLIVVERAGEIVKKRDLMARVWPDTIVEQGTLRVHIAALRKPWETAKPECAMWRM